MYNHDMLSIFKINELANSFEERRGKLCKHKLRSTFLEKFSIHSSESLPIPLPGHLTYFHKDRETPKFIYSHKISSNSFPYSCQ